ncbi:MAG: DUF4214 domain-containing protein [Clostridiales bacterium]|nr:DUF4214 domain-containing protein [Clostridiales bacterium]
MERTHSIRARSFSVVLAVLMVLALLPKTAAASVTVPDDRVDLYFLTESEAEVISMPSSYKSEYQISAGGSSSGYSYRVISGDSVNVSSDGLVSIRSEQMTVISLSTGTSSIRTTFMTGESTVRVTSNSDGSYRDIVFEVHDYGAVYCEGVMDRFIAENITPDMTVREKAVAITRYTAENFDYNGHYSSGYSMILYGGGDCWASTGLIITIAHRCGLEAWVRNGNKDPGAGSGHRNAMIADPDNNCWYECEAGFSGNKPRTYFVTTRTDLFSYRTTGAGVVVYQYDGDTFPEDFVIPSVINDRPVVGISDGFIHSPAVKRITLPPTLQSIGDYAFSACTSLESITIPASVTSIGKGAFAQCSSLNTLNVESGNNAYCSSENVIYSSDGTALVAAPNVSSVTIPSTVTAINDYAFYYNDKITDLTIPSSVTTIGEGAFGNCSNLASLTIQGNSLTGIDSYAFAYTPYLRGVELPASVTDLSSLAFCYAGSFKVSIPASAAPTIIEASQQDSLFVQSSDNITVYVKSDASGYGDSWAHENVTIVRSSDPVADMRAAIAADIEAEAAASGSSGTSGGGSGDPSVTPTPAIPTLPPVSSGSSGTSESGVAGFVERLYTVALGRASDPAGKQDWVDAITLRGETGASAARGFLYSPEFLNKQVSNELFVSILYHTFFDRDPDQDGFNAWVNALNNGASKEEVIEGFINSTEWANLCLRYGIIGGGTGVPNVSIEPNQATIDFATRLYTTCLGRSADPNGLMAWARQLANRRDTGTGAARGFFFSDEFTRQNVSNGEYVTRLYRTFMGREPDQAGYDAWVSQLDSGVSREEVFDGFAQSPEFTRICASYGIVR